MTNDSRVNMLIQRVDRLEAELVDLRVHRDFLTTQVTLLAEAILKLNGACPTCGEVVKDWKEPLGLFPRGVLRERGIDPTTGHKRGCSAARSSRR